MRWMPENKSNPYLLTQFFGESPRGPYQGALARGL
jgi:hypothetical protein